MAALIRASAVPRDKLYASTFASRLEAIREFQLRHDASTASLRFANLADDLLRAEALIAQHPGLG